MTAGHALEDLAKVHSGDRVLIHSGAGGVGLAAIQVARRAGAEIFATAGSERKRDYLRSLGVGHVFDSRTTKFAEQILTLTGGHGVDVVLNSLADEFVGATLACVAKGGRCVEIGKRGIWTPEAVRALGKDIEYHVVDLSGTANTEPQRIAALLARLVKATEAGWWTPLPHRSFPFHEARAAYRYMAQARHIGKIVLRQQQRALRISPHATYLITGGFGGLGVSVAGRLIARGARHLALVSRGGAPEHVLATIGRWRAAGVQVTVHQADVSDRSAMAGLFASIEQQLPPLRGIVHAAGTLDDGTLVRQSLGRFASVMAPKVKGSWILHELSAKLPLDFFVLFSSIAAILGSPGQANHAAANAFEDALAQARRKRGLVATSIDWGAWAEVGSASSDALSRRRELMGLGSFTTLEGLEIFEQAAASGYAQICAARLQTRRAARDTQASPLLGAAVPRESEAPLLDQLAQTPAVGRPASLSRYLETVARRVLGLAPGHAIDARTPLHELGLDSLMAIEFRNIVSGALKRSLPATMLFSYPAIEDLTRYLCGELLEEPPASPSARGSMLDQIESLSDADVDEMLAARNGGLG